MLRRSFRLGVLLGLLSGVVWALRKAGLFPGTETVSVPSKDPWTPVAAPQSPEPAPAFEAPAAPSKRAAAAVTAAPASVARVEEPAPGTWVEASGTLCPETHPIKAKLSSRIFHLPGMLAYDRTRPDRCYATAEAADADGFTKAKR
jgi:hypothetical protein